jgi:hypothetical protein
VSGFSRTWSPRHAFAHHSFDEGRFGPDVDDLLSKMVSFGVGMHHNEDVDVWNSNDWCARGRVTNLVQVPARSV